MNSNGMLLWAAFAVVCATIYLYSKKLKRETEEGGIEATGVVSRISDMGDPDEITLLYYVLYRTEDGEEVEALLSNPRGDLVEGEQVRIKYHPKHKMNARLV